MPAEYGVDPTGLGDLFGYTEMGEIKAQLAEEAQADRAIDYDSRLAAQVAAVEAASGGQLSGDIPSANTSKLTPAGRSDKISLVLKPGEGAEVKLQMKAGKTADYAWFTKGGAVNADLHGDGGGQNVSYAKQRSVTGDKGTITAKFDGNHGWYWRNRSSNDVMIYVEASGEYAAMKRML
jgi:hypothetical protein